MIINELYKDKFIKHYSDKGCKILQVETGRLFNSTIDTNSCRFTYEETDIDIADYKKSLEVIISER